jgi:hypothetical protein
VALKGEAGSFALQVYICVFWRAGLLAGRAESSECLLEICNTVGQEANPSIIREDEFY